jgi:hypothetical protein
LCAKEHFMATKPKKKAGEDGIEAGKLKEYQPGQAFNGVIGRTFDVSEPAWPAPHRAREGAPNVLFIVLDDTGFGHLGCRQWRRSARRISRR